MRHSLLTGSLSCWLLACSLLGGCSDNDDASGPAGAGQGGSPGGSGGASANGPGGASSSVGGTSAGGSSAAGSSGSSGQASAPTCAAVPGGGTATVSAPTLKLTLKDRYEEAWLGAAAVADLDGDGAREVVVPRGDKLLIWSGASGEVKARVSPGKGRLWASPVVADLRPDHPGLEVAFAAGDSVFVVDAKGATLPGFPVAWQPELRSLAAADLDGDGSLELVVAPTTGGKIGDVMNAWHADGSPVAGFPPNASKTSGCDDRCYLAGCYDQNVALGDLDGDGHADVVVGHDNAYASFHRGSGEAFDASALFPKAKKTPGVRYLHDLALAEQGYADDEDTALQAHFTNTAPAIGDIDGDGQADIVMLGSVQNAAQSDRLKGVGVWALHRDASRLAGWEEPLHVPDYLAGLWDFDDTNVVAATNQVALADIDPSPGLEIVFAGFDGRIHAVSAGRTLLWSTAYTTDPHVLTGGVAIGDLSGDGRPEIVFASYSTDADKGALHVLDAQGHALHRIPLPRRGAMPVPTLADVDGDGTLDIVVSLKDAEDKVASVLVYTVPGAAENCLPWPTGRGNYLRNGRAL